MRVYTLELCVLHSDATLMVKTAATPRLIIIESDSSLDPRLVEALQGAFQVTRVADLAEARAILARHPNAWLLGDAGTIGSPGRAPVDVASLLAHMSEGVGVVDAQGKLLWSNAALDRLESAILDQFVDTCLTALEQLNDPDLAETPVAERESLRYLIDAGNSSFEVLVSASAPVAKDDRHVGAVVGVMSDVTAIQKLQTKLDAIDAAGAELMRIEASSIAELSVTERLALLEKEIVSKVRELLHFDNFEIRLIDHDTNRLELAIAVGIAPEKVGEVIFAEPEGSGICGRVASTGESYICNNVRDEPLYREGLDNAASSLTVPLRLQDRIVGVFNIESKTPSAFNEDDRRFAEIFGRYIAMAMNILNLLVVERSHTSQQLTGMVSDVLDDPLKAITDAADALEKKAKQDPAMREGLAEILAAVGRVRSRIRTYSAGPRTIIDAEHELHKESPDPRMIGKRILIADDEPAIRDTIGAIMSNKGCKVTVCRNGQTTLDALKKSKDRALLFDLVISDIKMPDFNGYQVFQAAKDISPDIPVILMTGFGYDPHHSIVRASQEGLHCFLFKPFKASQLLDQVISVFEKEEEEDEEGTEAQGHEGA